MDLRFHLRCILFICAINFGTVFTDKSVPCLSMPGCQCDENETIIKCENKIGLSILSGIKPNVISLTVKNSFLGPMLNTSFSSYIMEVQELDLSHDRIHTLTPNVFKYLRNLRTLILRNNYLRILQPEVFQHLTSLEKLDLSYNRFQILPDRPLYSLISLNVINVSYNNLTSLKLGLRFQVMEHMQVLDFSGNKFQTISKDAFNLTTSWWEQLPKTMNLSHCGIKNIESGAFKNPKGIEKLLLEGNVGISLKNLTNLFNSSESPQLRIINLSNTDLNNVSGLFLSLRERNIQELSLSNNNITELPLELSENLAGTLLKFTVNYNMLTSLSASVAELTNLKYLDMSNNRIENIDSKFDSNLENLQYLNLANNQIPSGQFTLEKFTKLTELDLSFNDLNSYVIPRTLEELHTVNLAGNGMQNLSSLDGLTNLKTFNFQKNKLTTLQKFLFVDSPSIKAVNFSQNQIENIDDSAFDPHSPQDIDLSYNKLTKLKFSGWENVKAINLRGNQLENIHGESFYALFQMTSLDLAENKLIFIEDSTFLYLTNLTSLNLQHNQLLGIPNWQKLFKTLINLETLDLSYNNISKLNSGIFTKSKSIMSIHISNNFLSFVDPSGFKSMTKLQEVDFSNNRFICNCELISFRDWLKTSGIEIVHKHSGNYSCLGPSEKKGQKVMDFEIDEFECNFMFLYITVYSTIGGIFVVVVIVSAFVCHYHFKWRREELHRSSGPPSIEFESMEHAPFIPDKTLERKSKAKRVKTDKAQTKKKGSNKMNSKEHCQMYFMNGHKKHLQNGTLSNGTVNVKSSKTHHKKRNNTKPRNHSISNTYLFKHNQELMIPKPKRRAQSNLEMNPFVQEYIWQQYKKQQKYLTGKRRPRESFRNVDIIRPSQSSPDFQHVHTLPRSRNTTEQRLNEMYREMGTRNGPRSRTNTHLSSGNLQQIDHSDYHPKTHMSGYNTISGVPSHRSHAHYI